ncbi:MAG: HPr family phosphocarrier protein [Bifidobacteriaceae bacterium]|jgi:phosphocarrier protein|nr:HPr family phosphocarrier protein [Bifidobacteriaceae bacterium]
MKVVEYTVTDELGIHARPAGMLVKLAQGFASKIDIIKGGKKANLKGIIGIMSLGVKQGETVSIEVDGEDEDAAAAGIEAFLKENL